LAEVAEVPACRVLTAHARTIGLAQHTVLRSTEAAEVAAGLVVAIYSDAERAGAHGIDGHSLTVIGDHEGRPV